MSTTGIDSRRDGQALQRVPAPAPQGPRPGVAGRPPDSAHSGTPRGAGVESAPARAAYPGPGAYGGGPATPGRQSAVGRHQSGQSVSAARGARIGRWTTAIAGLLD